jgi:diguanylate cyclase (GGDEF)-like protein/PAS domain S-box-containing protein
MAAMKRLINLVANNAEGLFEKFMTSVNNNQTPVLPYNKDASCFLCADLSSLFVQVLREDSLASSSFSGNGISGAFLTTLGKLRVQNYLQRGLKARQTIDLIRFCCQSYFDLIEKTDWESGYKKFCQEQVFIFFDYIKYSIGLLWADLQEENFQSLELRSGRKELVQSDNILPQEKEQSLDAQVHFHAIVEFLPDATFVVDRNRKVVAWNKAMEKMTGVTKETMTGQDSLRRAFSLNDDCPMLIDYIFEKRDVTELPRLSKYHSSVKKQNDAIYAELSIPYADKTLKKTLLVKVAPLYDSGGNIIAAMQSIRDITEYLKTEQKLKYITFHDPLTNVYNRAYFEQEMQRLAGGRFNPVGIVIADVDGLKVINDTLGHKAGDELLITAAHLIQQCFRNCDVVSRIGGDEFAVLLPNCNKAALEKACLRLKNEVTVFNREHFKTIPLSLSLGHALAQTAPFEMDELFKKADNRMYREKLHHSQSIRSNIVNTLTKALAARDIITNGHAERMKELVENFAKAVALSERQRSDLCLLAQFHDIGKVGLSDQVLFKNGFLTLEERLEIERHCEIGYRIAKSSVDLAPIADWILKHHERWDGKGYPLGLQGDQIPLECRILAIADAYDAMVSNRPYRRALPRAAALKEIQRCAGTQFDPSLADIFVNLVVLATTTSTLDTGLLDILVPMFQKQSGYKLRIVAVGTGEALRMGKTGHADALLVHAPKDEWPLVHGQVAVNYQLVMHNDFILLGPPRDPAGIKGVTNIVEAFQKIADCQASFVSRGDDSGTDKKEKEIWNKAGANPIGQPWYRETGQGMGAALIEANERKAYILSDRGTYLAKTKNIMLNIVSEGDGALKNIYHVMQINPEKFGWINEEGAKAFVEFMIDHETQQTIKGFSVSPSGKPLFFPDRLHG